MSTKRIRHTARFKFTIALEAIKSDKTINLFDGLTHYIRFYNEQRPHQSLNYATPAEVYRS